LIPTLLGRGKGLGLGYQYKLNNQFSIGPFGSFSMPQDKPDKDNVQFYDADFERVMAGIEARYFFGEFGDGFYLSAAGNYSRIEGKAKIRPRQLDPITTEKDQKEKLGFLAGIGYSGLTRWSVMNSRLLIDV